MFDNEFEVQASEILRRIEKRSIEIEKEMAEKTDRFYQPSSLEIYTALVDKRNIDIGKSWFQLMNFYDYSKDEILNILNEKANNLLNMPEEVLKPFIMKSCYMSLSYSQIEELIENAKEYKGFFIDDRGDRYEFKYYLEYNSSFVENERKLAELYYLNNIEWIGIYSPFSRKVFNIVVKELCFLIEELEKIKEIEFEKIDGLELNKIPVWNVNFRSEMNQLSKKIPSGNEEYCYFEIQRKKDEKILYGSSEGEIDYMEMEEEITRIFFKVDTKINRWEVCEIKGTDRIQETDIEKYSNIRRKKGLHGLGGFKGKTRAEIKALIESYIDIGKIGFIEFLKEIDSEKKIKSYLTSLQYNQFLDNDFLYDRNRKKMGILIKKYNKDDLYYEDRINFILSILKQNYPEVVWLGCEK